MTKKLVSTIDDLRELPGFADAWAVCQKGLLPYLNERLIHRAKGQDIGAINELSKLLDDLRSIGVAESSPTNPPTPLMKPLHSMTSDPKA